MNKIVGVLAALATYSFPLVLAAYPPVAAAQTHGMNRRDDRRDTRQGARTTKQACKSTGDTRAECRQDKRNTKQQGRRTPTPR